MTQMVDQYQIAVAVFFPLVGRHTPVKLNVFFVEERLEAL